MKEKNSKVCDQVGKSGANDWIIQMLGKSLAFVFVSW